MLPGRPEGRRRCHLIDRMGFQKVQPLGKMGRGAQRVRADPGLNAGAAPAGIAAAGAVGVGVIRLGDAFLSLGTSRVLFLAGEKFVPNPAHAVHAFCHALPRPARLLAPDDRDAVGRQLRRLGREPHGRA